ncbi:hypothetical protein BV25DRAFT_225077 [Artomyces pyxidatus]|uniref:Uncharacterized protein n=1 Tax=Artomyces pyxidatus TaxID=48021 RepID=A0ACB8TAF4_9AGAM|nr:hypothetical protein BV25DRAFT_225077 [Artomyces pyxidatus]
MCSPSSHPPRTSTHGFSWTKSTGYCAVGIACLPFLRSDFPHLIDTSRSVASPSHPAPVFGAPSIPFVVCVPLQSGAQKSLLYITSNTSGLRGMTACLGAFHPLFRSTGPASLCATWPPADPSPQDAFQCPAQPQSAMASAAPPSADDCIAL